VKRNYFLAFLLALPFLQGCVTTDVDRAFNGKLEVFQETSVIVEYCRSCHSHREFNPSNHLGEAPFKYKKPPHNKASDCKTCHSIKRNIWNEIIKYTYFPDGSIIETP